MTRKELKAVYEKFENENPEFKGISQEAFGDAPWEGYVSLDELKERRLRRRERKNRKRRWFQAEPKALLG